jgi:hypothetical protein
MSYVVFSKSQFDGAMLNADLRAHCKRSNDRSGIRMFECPAIGVAVRFAGIVLINFREIFDNLFSLVWWY